MRRKVRKIIDSQSFFCTFFLHFLVESSAFLGRRWRDFRLVVARFWVGGGVLSGEQFSFFDMHIFAFRIALFRFLGCTFSPKAKVARTKNKCVALSDHAFFNKIRHAQNSSRAKFVTRIKTSPAKLLRPFACRKLLRPFACRKRLRPLRSPLRSPTRRMGCSPREISQDRPDAPTHG